MRDESSRSTLPARPQAEVRGRVGNWRSAEGRPGRAVACLCFSADRSGRTAASSSRTTTSSGPPSILKTPTHNTPPPPLYRPMKVTQKLAQAQQEDRTWWSFEFFPPRTAQGLQVRRFAHARPPPIEVLDDETPASFLNFESLILDGKTDSAPAPLFPDRTSMIGSNVYVLHPSSCR